MFTWIAFYEDLANKLLAYRGRETELIAFLEGLRRDGMPIVSLDDQDASGNRSLLTTIDPFTVFGIFNRGITSLIQLVSRYCSAFPERDRHSAFLER